MQEYNSGTAYPFISYPRKINELLYSLNGIPYANEIEDTFVVRAKELEVQTNLLETKTSEECFIGLNHRVYRL